MITYTLTSILWAISGLVVGFLLGRAGQSVRVTDQEMAAAVTGSRRTKTDTIVGLAVVVMAVVSVLTMSVGLARQQRIVDCQTEFNARFVAVLKERSDAAANERESQRQLLTTMLDRQPGTTGQAAIEQYLRSLADADQARSDYPLPDRPSC